MQTNFATYRKNMRREMTSADNLYARANTLRTSGRTAEADELEAKAEHIDNRLAASTYSTWRLTVWPTYTPEHRAQILAEVRRLRTDGWDIQEAWIQAACTL